MYVSECVLYSTVGLIDGLVTKRMNFHGNDVVM